MSLYLIGADTTVGAAGNYDHLFIKYAGRIPPQLLRMVSKRESTFDPLAHAESRKYPGTDIARGLFQITKVALAEFNRTRGTSYKWGPPAARATLTAHDVWNPEINAMIGAGLANDIVKSYAATGIPGLKPDWTDPRWVALFIYGWSAGHSAKSGVIYVAKVLHREKVPITVANIAKRAATLAGAHDQLPLAKKARWAEEGAAIYMKQSGVPMKPQPPAPRPSRPGSGRRSLLSYLLGGAIVAGVAYGFSKAG